MANTNVTTITNAQALAAMVNVCVNGESITDTLAALKVSKADFDKKVTHMLAVAVKPKSKGAKVPSKAARENAATVAKVVELINSKGERVNSLTIANEFGLGKTQKAVCVANMGIANGDLVRVIVKSRVFYSTPALEDAIKEAENTEDAIAEVA